MLKNYNYMLTILLYPFLLIISYLKIANYLKGSLYTDLIIIMLIIFIPSFIMSLYCAAEEILTSDKKWRIVFLVLLSVFYLPIFYTKYISKDEKYLGYILFILTIPLTYLMIVTLNNKLLIIFNEVFRDKIVLKDTIVYNSTNNLFSINIDYSFRCNSENIGDYVISCDKLADDSFIGIYSYDVSFDDEEEIKEKFDFHINQTIDYIKDKGYSYQITSDEKITQIEYNDNIILISQNIYFIEEDIYSLIIMKEMPREYVSYDEYQKMIDSIKFLNYNDGVSS